MRVRLAGVAVAALALSPVASAGGLGLAEVRGPQDSVLASVGGGSTSYSYPSDGSIVQLASATSTAAGVDLRGISLLGGRVRADRVFVPAHGVRGARIEGLVVEGQLASVAPNSLVSLGTNSYLVALQEAVLPVAGHKSLGLIGLRLSVGDSSLGVPAGTQILVGVAAAARFSPERTSPLALLGFDQSMTAATFGPASVAEPFTAMGSVGSQAVSLALRFLGVPYVWGGDTPSGFDCSGLVKYVYGQLGISLPHFSGLQWSAGPRVPRSQLQPGDVVFFDMGPAGPGHEGIYIGNGEFVQAPHTGDVVKISSLDRPEYALRYVGAVRLAP